MKNLKSLENFSRKYSNNDLVDKVLINGGAGSFNYYWTEAGSKDRGRQDVVQWDTCF